MGGGLQPPAGGLITGGLYPGRGDGGLITGIKKCVMKCVNRKLL